MATEEVTSVAFLRICRVFRLLRIVKVVRALKFLRSLRTMIYSVMNSFASLMWALLMIGIVVYVFAIIFVGAVTTYFRQLDFSNNSHAEDAQKVSGVHWWPILALSKNNMKTRCDVDVTSKWNLSETEVRST